MTTFRCPRCRWESRQPPHVNAMWHRCAPPGRVAKVTQLIAVDNDGETNNQPTSETRGNNAHR